MKITLFPILRAFMLIVACSIFGQLFCYSTTLCVYDDQLSAVELLNSFRGTVKEEYVKRSELPHFLKTKRAQLSHVTHLKLLNSSKNKKKEKSLLTKEEFESLYFDYIPSLNTISLVCASLPKGINWEKIYETRYKNFLEIYIDEAYKLSQKELLNTLSTFP
ncbi:TPA: hypothetical protein DCW54_02665, partial [Candidatus Dependentiae bacterium]|nr:hypothetical protein [Candidatus Dependentiae bacterium]